MISENFNDFSVAHEFFQAGKLQESAQMCRQILSARADDFDAMHLLGRIALQMGESFRAAQLFKQSIDIKSSDAVAFVNLGLALYQQGELEAAISEYRRAIKIKNNFPEARKLLAATRDEVKRLDQLIKSLDKSNQAPSIRYSIEEKKRKLPEPATLNLATKLYKHFGYLIIEDLFLDQYIDELHDSFVTSYSHYFADKVFDDSLKVGDKRAMVTVELDGPFNSVEYYANPLIMPILARLLGRDLILFSMGAVVSLPGAQRQRTHRDHRALFDDDVDAMLPSFTVTVGVPLIEMNNETGTTRVYGRTHRKNGDLSDKDKNLGINPVIRKGSCMLFDYRIFHEGTPNNSKNVRPLMYNIYSRPWFRDCQNYSKQEPMNISDSAWSQIPDEYKRLFLWNRR